MRLDRYVTHGVLLLVAALISGYTFSVHLVPRAGAIDAVGLEPIGDGAEHAAAVVADEAVQADLNVLAGFDVELKEILIAGPDATLQGKGQCDGRHVSQVTGILRRASSARSA